MPIIRIFCLGLVLAGIIILPPQAMARDNTVVGVGTGAVAGALVAGPVGAVVGGIVGGMVGANSERARPRRSRQARPVRARRQSGPVRVAEKRPAASRSTSMADAAANPPATVWTNPR